MDIRIEDLLPDYEHCGGTGQVGNPELKKNQGGFGRRVISPQSIDCNVCHGKGVIITESGKTLLKFFRIAKEKHFLY